MNKSIITIISAVLLSACSQDAVEEAPKTLESGYLFCTDANSWDLLNEAKNNQDNRLVSQLGATGKCGVLKEGLEYSVLNRTWTTANVRVWLNDQHFDIYTNIEAIR